MNGSSEGEASQQPEQQIRSRSKSNMFVFTRLTTFDNNKTTNMLLSKQSNILTKKLIL